MQQRQSELSPKRWWLEIALSAAAYAGIYLALSYPLYRNPGSTLFRPGVPWGDPDVNLVVWILSWGWHALTRHPEQLFDANIFYPAEHTFTGSEHLLGYAPLFGPVYELTANPVLANQITILLSFAIAGAGMYGLLRHWKVPIGAAFLGGFVNAFFPSRFAALGAPQMLATGFLPIALAHLDSLLLKGRIGSAFGFGIFAFWQMLCSVYLGFVALAGLASYGIAIALTGIKSIRIKGVVAATLVLLAVGASLAVFHLPYTEMKTKGVIPEYDSTGKMSLYSNGWYQNYLTRPQSIRSGATQLGRGKLLYVGVLPAIALLGLLLPRRRETPPWAAAGGVAMTIAGYVLGLGPTARLGGRVITLPYSYLNAIVPGFSSMRVPDRFGFLFMTGVAALVGLGAGRILDRVDSASRNNRWIGVAVVAAVLALTVLDYDLLAEKFETRTVASLSNTIPEVYRKVGELPRGPILEVPIPRNPLFRDRRASLQMYYSTFHWRPLLNGYTGHAPPSYELIRTLAEQLPDPAALDLLCRMSGLRYVIYTRDENHQRWRSPDGLEELGRFGDKTLFALERSCSSGDLIEQLRRPAPWSDTLEGTPIRPIQHASSANLRYDTEPPHRAKAQRDFQIAVDVSNPSTETWPTLAPVGSDVVTVGYRWEEEDGSVYWPLRENRPRAALFPRDVRPGTTTRVQVDVTSPFRPGTHWLVVGLCQGNEWIARIPGRVRVDIQ